MSAGNLIKQIATGRRKPDMTRKEYFDHRFRIHGHLSDDNENENEKPYKYIQTQVFDSAFGPRQGGGLNANQHWCGRDDTTELYFRDWDHVTTAFNSDFTKTKIGPDGPFFADFETSIILMAREEPVATPTRLASQRAGVPLNKGDATVAMYFISAPDNAIEGQRLHDTLTPLLVKALEQDCQDEVWGVIANVGVVSDKFDLNAYFGGGDMPQYCLVYKVFLKDAASVPSFRKSQKRFAAAAKDAIDTYKSFVLFSKEALVMDVSQRLRFSLDRQPVFDDLPGPSHLSG
ncbi:hypothetical protein LX36DRAFT_646107 [Colletotrichum falcatum]|nr:hypothetical protein LX36DRAFT_646107 [Colletotrichum falcatum]